MPALPLIRQVVLLVPELEPALKEFRQAFGFTEGTRSSGMAKWGFEHEVFTLNDSFLEICAPLKADSHPGKLVARRGAMGYMVVVQVDDLNATVARAATQDIKPLFVQDLHEHLISQWHPKSLGSLVEVDQINPPDSWHFAPEILEKRCTDVAFDIVGAVMAVDNPERMAATWSSLFEVPLVDPTTVDLQRSRLKFVPIEGDRAGLVTVDLTPGDRGRVGETVRLGGVDFRFVSNVGGTQ